MKRASNNEIDLLLRKLARHETDPAKTTQGDGGVPAGVAGDHLDADELNAYAENAVPTTSRIRYTEHLADCAMCRKLVVELSRSATVSASYSTVETKAPSSLKQFLAWLFSPLVLRYVGPAFAVIAVVAVALVVLQQKRTIDFVAQNQRGSSSTLVGENEEKAKAPVLKDNVSEKATTASGEQQQSDTRAVNRAAREDTQKAQAFDKATTDDSRKMAKEAPRDEASSVAAEAPPKFAPEPAAAPAPKPVANEVETDKEVARQKKPAAVEEAGSKEGDANSKLDRISASRSGPQKTESLPVAGRSVQGILSKDAPARVASEKRARNDEDVRSIAGRRFIKKGGVWVDSAYDSSRPTVNLSRGSEQYRALIADEPGIRTIAEQLDGEVVVVWKGRVYRIR
jgi:hypothetical protein